MMQLSQISQAVSGRMLGRDVMLQGISINTRTDCENRLFVALRGERFDAHDFIDQAQDAGAGAALIERLAEEKVETAELPSVVVEDTHQALKDLASWWRGQFVLPLIGVTGSVGKTSVKEMLGVIFQQIGRGVVTKGNLNNEIGVPLTLMRLRLDDHYAIVEMGMNHAGEISRITQIARPTIALINNAAAAHLEGLGSIAAVAQAKAEIFEGLAPDGVAVINNDDAFAEQWKQQVGKRRIVTFALNNDADVTASYQQIDNVLSIKVSGLGFDFDVQIATVGEHNVANALAAIATALAANIPIAKIQAGLREYRPISGRLNLQSYGSVTLIDDTYNASPLSMRAAIKVLAAYQDTTLIIGDMAELGAAAEQEHKQLGRVIAEAGIDNLLVCGQFAERVMQGYQSKGAERAQSFKSQAELIEFADRHIDMGAVLIKGSRSAQMENVVVALQAKFRANLDGQGDH